MATTTPTATDAELRMIYRLFGARAQHNNVKRDDCPVEDRRFAEWWRDGWDQQRRYRDHAGE